MRPCVVLLLLSACVGRETRPPSVYDQEWDVAQRNTSWELLGVGYVVREPSVVKRQTLAQQLAKDEQHRNFSNYAITLARRCQEPAATAEDLREASLLEAMYRALEQVTTYSRRDDASIGETFVLARAEVAKFADQIASDATLESSLRSCLHENAAAVATELTTKK